MPSAFVRARSHTLREIAARVLPRSVLFAHGDRHARRKRIALTFDDGPDAMTEEYLDVLDELGVRATFFLIGELAARRPASVLEYVQRGHEIGGHGWTHTAFSPMSGAALGEELAKTTAALGAGRASSVRVKSSPALVRPPRGILSPRALFHLVSAGYTTVMWSVDSDDCRTRDPRVVERKLHPTRVAPGDVVLMHETQPWTMKSLPGVVGRLRDAGYELVTIGELLNENSEDHE